MKQVLDAIERMLDRNPSERIADAYRRGVLTDKDIEAERKRLAKIGMLLNEAREKLK